MVRRSILSPLGSFHTFPGDEDLLGESCIDFQVSDTPQLTFIELDDGKIYRKPLYLMVKTMVSCRFSLKPIHWDFKLDRLDPFKLQRQGLNAHRQILPQWGGRIEQRPDGRINNWNTITHIHTHTHARTHAYVYIYMYIHLHNRRISGRLK